MKGKFDLPKTQMSACAFLLVMLANAVTYSGSFLLFGEPEAPKSLLK